MKRVLSLLPSTTEVIYALHAQETLVGVTHECDFPPEARQKPQLTDARITPSMASDEIDALVRQQLEETGSLYTLDMDLVRELRPEIVFTQQLCTVCAVGYETVRGAMMSLPDPPDVINIEPANLQEVFQSFREIANLLEVGSTGIELITSLQARLEQLPRLPEPPRVLFLEWLIPPFSAGHWIPDLILAAGAEPVLDNRGAYSRQLDWETIRTTPFDTLVISCCGFDLNRTVVDILNSPELRSLREERDVRLIVFDGNHFFSRPGPRLVESAELLNAALRGIAPFDYPSTIPEPYRELT